MRGFGRHEVSSLELNIDQTFFDLPFDSVKTIESLNLYGFHI